MKGTLNLDLKGSTMWRSEEMLDSPRVEEDESYK